MTQNASDFTLFAPV